jgi:hypothetical protein
MYRPILLARSSHRLDTTLEATALGTGEVCALWLARCGSPLTYSAVERLITETTRTTLGVAVNPHRFRTSAATSAALHAPQSPHLGSALLQHSDPRVTQEHYIRASSLSVAWDFTALIANLRRSRSRCGKIHDECLLRFVKRKSGPCITRSGNEPKFEDRPCVARGFRRFGGWSCAKAGPCLEPRLAAVFGGGTQAEAARLWSTKEGAQDARHARS